LRDSLNICAVSTKHLSSKMELLPHLFIAFLWGEEEIGRVIPAAGEKKQGN